MIKINRKIEKTLQDLKDNKIGTFFDSYGSFIDDDVEFVLYYGNGEIYLAHVSEFEFKGLFTRLKQK